MSLQLLLPAFDFHWFLIPLLINAKVVFAKLYICVDSTIRRNHGKFQCLRTFSNTMSAS